MNIDETQERMKDYLDKIASGPEQSKDLTEAEAEDALRLILRGAASPIRSALFLVASRMKRETLEENIGFWKALDRTTIKHSVKLNRLLQVADPFDGFNRAPYFGFYAIPVMADMGLPAYGHSTLSLPPKFGTTFENILYHHYRVPHDLPLDTRIRLLEEYQFGYFSTHQTHPSLEGLRELRMEMVKRTVLSTFEKMLLPLKAGENHLATGYFHKGYETPMLAVARLGEFDKVLVGNGMEGTTLYGVHKTARVFIHDKHEAGPREATLEVAGFAGEAYTRVKKERLDLGLLAEWGEAALKGNPGPAATLIACQAGSLCYLLGLYASFQEAFNAATETLNRGTAHNRFLQYIDQCRQ